MIKLQQLNFTLGDFALSNINLEIPSGKYFVLLGPTGAGKTILLETISGLLTCRSGRITVNDRDVSTLPLHRRPVGIVFQDQCLFSHMRVRDNIAYALRIAGRSRHDINRRVNALADELGITGILKQFPHTLSGGERQQVALARTLIAEPQCLLLDEPLSAVDTVGRSTMRILLKSLQRRHNLTVLHVTHDFEDALALADMMGVMDAGRLIETGLPEQLFTQPRTQFVADFLNCGNLLNGAIVSKNGISEFVTTHNKFALPPQSITGAAYVLIKPEHIVISPEPLTSSARNCIMGRITDISTRHTGICRVEVDAGDLMHVTVLARTAQQMELQKNKQVYLTFKSSAVHVIDHVNNFTQTSGNHTS